MEPTERPTLRTAQNPDELAKAALFFAWYEKHGQIAPDELLVPWSEFVSIWLRTVTVAQMAVVNRNLEIVLGDTARWTPWPLGSDAPFDVRAIPRTAVTVQITKSRHEVLFEILDVMDVHRRWLDLPPPRPDHPLVTVILGQQSTPDESHISHVNGMTRIPYTASEVVRRSWREDRAVSDVELDGKALDEHLSIILADPVSRRRLYVDSPELVNSVGRLRLSTTTRSNIYPQDARRRPLPMVAWRGVDSSLLQDLWILLTVVYGSTRAIVWTDKDGARLLARNASGGLRGAAESDPTRWHRLLVYANSIEIWFADRRGSRFVKVAYIYEIERGRVSIDKPTWYDESEGRFTLTGAAHRARHVGEGSRRAYSKLVGCMEYWLARSYDGTPGIAWLLRPANRGNSPGAWAPAPSGKTEWWKWYEVLEVLLLEQVNREDSTGRAAALARYHRSVEGLRRAGYLHHDTCESEDAVEVEVTPRRRGATPALRFRATARSCEAARLAQDGMWSTTPLFSWLETNAAVSTVTDSESPRHRALRERRRALTWERVQDALRRCKNNLARAEHELQVGGTVPGNYLRGWLRRHRDRKPKP